MKKRTFLVSLLFVFLAELMALILFANHDIDNTQDAVLVNEAVQSVRMDWDNM